MCVVGCYNQVPLVTLQAAIRPTPARSVDKAAARDLADLAAIQVRPINYILHAINIDNMNQF